MLCFPGLVLLLRPVMQPALGVTLRAAQKPGSVAVAEPVASQAEPPLPPPSEPPPPSEVAGSDKSNDEGSGGSDSE